MSAAASGLGLYLFVCLFSALCGRGLVRLLGLKVPACAEALLAPIVTYLFWSVTLGASASLGLAVRHFAPWLWAVSAALAVAGWPRTWPAWRAGGLAWLACAFFPVLALNALFLRRLTESVDAVAMDGWYYLAGGVYAWKPGMWHADNLNIVQRVAVTWPGHRHVTFTLLGFLSPLVRAGDTLAVAGLLKAWSLFCLGSAIHLACIARGWAYRSGMAVTLLAVDAGWVILPLWGNFFDTALALIYLPASTAVLSLWHAGDWRRWAFLGVLLAGLTYTYPPFLPFATGAAGLIALPRLWRERHCWRAWLAGGALMLLVWATLTWPEMAIAMGWLRYACVVHIPMPWLFHGLDQPRSYPGVFWALGGETCANHASRLGNALGWIFTALALLGLARLVRERDWGIVLCMVLVLGGCAYAIFALHDHYPASKFLSLTWWCFTAAVVAGCDTALGRLRGSTSRTVLAALLLGAAACLNFRLALWHRAPIARSENETQSACQFRHVGDIRRLGTDGTLLVAVYEWLASEIAVFYLRDLSFHLATPRHWLSNSAVAASVRHLAPVPMERIRYVLTDRECEGWSDLPDSGPMVWSAGPYTLWRVPDLPPDRVALVCVEPAPGSARTERGRYFWVGQEATDLYLVSGRAGTVRMDALFIPGPWQPTPVARKLHVETTAGHPLEVDLPFGAGSVTFPVSAGMNRLRLRVIDPPGEPTRNPTPLPGHDSLVVSEAHFSIK